MRKKKLTFYSESFKWQVVQEVLSGKYSKEEARRIYGIKSKSGILEWMRKFNGQDRKNKRTITREELANMAKTRKQKSLEERILELERELSISKHKAILNEKIIDIAEKELGLEIRKKYGAKQS